MLDPAGPHAPWRAAAAFLSGALLALAFPPFGLWWLAWVALVPLIVALDGASVRRAALCGYLLGVPYMAGIGYFTTAFGGDVLWMRLLPWLLFTAIESLFFVPVALLMRALLRRGVFGLLLGVPAVWTLGEWLRGAGPLGFPFGTFAQAMAAQPAVIQPARLGGAWLVTFLVALVSAAAYAVWGGHRRAGHAALAACLIVVITGIGRLQFAANHPLETAPTATVVLAQGSERRDWGEPDAVSDYHALAEATAAAARHAEAKADLAVWSESAVPGPLLEDPTLRAIAARTAGRLDAPLLTGAIGRLPDGRPANLAVLLRPDGSVAGTYQKRRLVPFGEWVPLRHVLPLLSQFGVVEEDEVPGTAWNVLTAGRLKLGVPICFESAVPGISRAFVRNGANLLVVITNDGWFGRTGMAEQHAAMSPLRAVETGRWLVRCGTTGISGFISPNGVWTSRLPLNTAGALLGDVALRTDTTPYVRYGDWFLWLCAVLSAWLAWPGRGISPRRRVSAVKISP